MYKRIVSVILILLLLLMTACGDSKILNVPAKTNTGYTNVEIGTYGLFNEGEEKNENVRYHIIIGNVIWSIVLVETIVAPIYFIGFSMYEPVRVKSKDDVKGGV